MGFGSSSIILYGFGGLEDYQKIRSNVSMQYRVLKKVSEQNRVSEGGTLTVI